MLADIGGGVAKRYGAHGPPLGTKRAVVVIDEDGVVRYRHDHVLGLGYQSVDKLQEALAALAVGLTAPSAVGAG